MRGTTDLGLRQKAEPTRILANHSAQCARNCPFICEQEKRKTRLPACLTVTYVAYTKLRVGHDASALIILTVKNRHSQRGTRAVPRRSRCLKRQRADAQRCGGVSEEDDGIWLLCNAVLYRIAPRWIQRAARGSVGRLARRVYPLVACNAVWLRWDLRAAYFSRYAHTSNTVRGTL